MNRHTRRAMRKRLRAHHLSQLPPATVTKGGDPDQLEKSEQWECVKLYRATGCEVIILSQPRATMQTEGIADLKVYCRRRARTWWQETKRPEGGKQSDDQRLFQDLVESCGEDYICGGFKEAYEHLQRIGVILG